VQNCLCHVILLLCSHYAIMNNHFIKKAPRERGAE
jgi:hypothetical protein